MIYIHTTIKNIEDAQALATEVISAKLAACVDYFPVKSTYLWEGKVETVEQYLMTFITHSEYAADLEARIEAKHSYAVPLIARTQIDIINNTYQEWANNTTKA